MSVLPEVLAANEAYAADFGDKGGLALPPARGFAILTCMDARLDPAKYAGLAEGDAHVIRNAGGVVTDDTLRSLTISQHLLGTRQVVLVHHTDCGMQKTDDQGLADLVEESTGHRPPWTGRTFTDLDADVRESMALLRATPYLLSHVVRGTVYDVATGQLREVV